MRISTFSINLLVIFLSLLSPVTNAQPPIYGYVYHFCQNTTTSAVNTTTYRDNRDTLLFRLSSTSIPGNGFYNATYGMSPNKAYGLFLCRGDVSNADCETCVTFAFNDRRCPVETTAVIWFSDCLLRYSNQNIFSLMAEEPSVSWPHTQFVAQDVTERDRFDRQVQAMMNDTATQAANEPPGAKKFATREANFTSFQTVYTLAECTPDISGRDCSICLRQAIANLSDCCSGKQGGRVLSPSCNIRYELYPFYTRTEVAAPMQPGEAERNKSNRIPILGTSLSAIFGLVVVSVAGFFIWRRRRRSNQDGKTIQEVQLRDLVDEHSRESFSEENVGKSQDFPSIQSNILQAATNNFSDENKLGEGGFGPVYKGTLACGKEIAVKRLSRTSGQGLVEFKNEVMSIAKLQHRNLVRLLGCCLEKSEKLLFYEFMPNRSLDVFLFDSNLAAQLDWPKRFNIIKGVARGILYLHEDSRLRIIHRDLKASNVLLDHNMNLKISNFGMARIFGGDKDEANTNRVVGTYGYMAPEYAMEGLFSIKSDVFSFGVILLEIVSGKKNYGFHLLKRGESLLSFAWKLWSKGEGMELIDQLLVPSFVVSEVLKCVHIGLLCVQADPTDRPTMSSVIVMLASDTISLPHPMCRH